MRAGFADRDVEIYGMAGHPREGGLVAVIRAAQPRDKGVLLVAHIDVVEVHRADWRRDPFKLEEEAGYFYGRGVSDNKAVAAALVDTLVRLKTEGFAPERDVRIALTCGEETATAFNGAEYLARSRRALIAAEFVLVPSAGARLDAEGRPSALIIQAGEKVQQNFTLETTSPGGHGSRPVKNDAVARLAAAVVRLDAFDFPVRLDEVVRAHFRQIASTESGGRAAALRALSASAPGAEPDPSVVATVVQADAGWNSMMRTTCAVTLLKAGEAANALAQTARATVNCRMLPSDSATVTERTLVEVVNDSTVAVVREGPPATATPAPPLSATVLDPIVKVAAGLWPGTPLVPTMLTGATDARHFNAIGLPAYGVTAVFNDPDGNGVHAANERVRVSAVYQAREFIDRLVREYAGRRATLTVP